MHIATKPNAAPFTAQLYPIALKHHHFLKPKIENLLDARIICKSMSPWASPIVVVKKHTSEGDYRKVNSPYYEQEHQQWEQRKVHSHLCL